MSHAIRIHNYGGPEVLKWENLEVGPPGPGEVIIRHGAVGLNFIDTYQRTGLYPLASLPATLGFEGAGEVTELGAGVSELQVGDRVAYGDQLGAYCEERVVRADRLVKLPIGISDKTAAAMMLQGMTVRYLFRKTYHVGPESVMLFHAAAGGVGLIACQWAKHLGATMIGTVGSEEKAELARANGCTHVINYREEDFVQQVKEITNGQGCDVVYDSIGKDTFPASLDCLQPLGLFVSYGNASGPISAFDLGLLLQKGSLFATRPSLFTHIASRNDLIETAHDLFDLVDKRIVKINVKQTYPLSETGRAHADLEARKTAGSTVLLP